MRRGGAEHGGCQSNSRRAMQLAVQRLVFQPSPCSACFPALCLGLDLGGAQEALPLPGLLAPMSGAATLQPTCVRCGAAVAWGDWREHAVMLPIGSGRFFGRCERCRGNDENFKETTCHGVSHSGPT
jgi:hypothetical protein